MKYSLRNLMIVAMVGPPLLAWGWRVLEAALIPELVYPGCHRVSNVSWEMATADIKALEIDNLRAEIAARNLEPPAP
jgi:hypothetical protein